MTQIGFFTLQWLEFLGIEVEVHSQLEISFSPAATQPILMNVCFMNYVYSVSCYLRLPHRNDAKIAEIFNFWTFWPVIQPINNLFKI